MELRNNKDETCLHLAVRSPLINTSTFETMVRSGADPQAKDQLGLTVWDIAQACNNKVALFAFNRYSKRIEPNLSGQSINNNICNENLSHIDSSHHDDAKEAEPQKLSCHSSETKLPELSQADESNSGKQTSKTLDEDYKTKYMSKNRENLENERKLIQLSAQLERIKLDLAYFREQNENLRLGKQKLTQENSKLLLENTKLKEQLSLYTKRSDSIGRTPSSSSSELPASQRDDSQETNIATSQIPLTMEHPDETIECRSQKEFLVARRMNQERISKLKNSLIT